MSALSSRPGRSYVFVTIGLISCSMLMYEILLTRVCALRLFFHFGFLVISNCLLGIGASGSLVGFGGGLPTKKWLLAHEQGQRQLPLD